MTSSDVATIPGYRVGTWVADPVHSTVGFSVRHLMVSRVRGHFAKLDATIVTMENPLESSTTATIQMASITTGNEDRDNHLRSSDFLGIENHPTMTFASTGMRYENNGYLLAGDLTIRGVSRPVVLDLELGGFGSDPYGFYRCGFSATGEINRTDFGITHNIVLETGGMAIGDKVRINIDIQAVYREDKAQ